MPTKQSMIECLILTATLLLPPTLYADSLKSTSIPCKSEEMCKLAMQASLQWLQQQSQYKVRIANDYMIETFGPHNGYSGPGFTVQRVVIDGQIGVSMTTRCWTQNGIAGLFAIECGSDEQSYHDSYLRFMYPKSPSVGQ